MRFLKDLGLCFFVIGFGFVAPFYACEKLFGFSVELSLVVGWIVCSLLTAGLLGEGIDDEE